MVTQGLTAIAKASSVATLLTFRMFDVFSANENDVCGAGLLSLSY